MSGLEERVFGQLPDETWIYPVTAPTPLQARSALISRNGAPGAGKPLVQGPSTSPNTCRSFREGALRCQDRLAWRARPRPDRPGRPIPDRQRATSASLLRRLESATERIRHLEPENRQLQEAFPTPPRERRADVTRPGSR